MFVLDLLAQRIFHVVISGRVVWKSELRRISRRISYMIKSLCLFVGVSETRL